MLKYNHQSYYSYLYKIKQILKKMYIVMINKLLDIGIRL